MRVESACKVAGNFGNCLRCMHLYNSRRHVGDAFSRRHQMCSELIKILTLMLADNLVSNDPLEKTMRFTMPDFIKV